MKDTPDAPHIHIPEIDSTTSFDANLEKLAQIGDSNPSEVAGYVDTEKGCDNLSRGSSSCSTTINSFHEKSPSPSQIDHNTATYSRTIETPLSSMANTPPLLSKKDEMLEAQHLQGKLNTDNDSFQEHHLLFMSDSEVTISETTVDKQVYGDNNLIDLKMSIDGSGSNMDTISNDGSCKVKNIEKSKKNNETVAYSENINATTSNDAGISDNLESKIEEESSNVGHFHASVIVSETLHNSAPTNGNITTDTENLKSKSNVAKDNNGDTLKNHKSSVCDASIGTLFCRRKSRRTRKPFSYKEEHLEKMNRELEDELEKEILKSISQNTDDRAEVNNQLSGANDETEITMNAGSGELSCNTKPIKNSDIDNNNNNLSDKKVTNIKNHKRKYTKNELQDGAKPSTQRKRKYTFKSDSLLEKERIKKSLSTNKKLKKENKKANNYDNDLSDLDDDIVTSRWQRMIQYNSIEPLSPLKVSKIQKQKKKLPSFASGEFMESKKNTFELKEIDFDTLENKVYRGKRELKKLKKDEIIRCRLSSNLQELTRAFESRYKLYEELSDKCKTLYKDIQIMEGLLFRDRSVPLIQQIKDFKFQMNEVEWKLFEEFVRFPGVNNVACFPTDKETGLAQNNTENDDRIPKVDIFDLKKIPRNNDKCQFIQASTFINQCNQHYKPFIETSSDSNDSVSNEPPTVKLFNPFLAGLYETYPLIIPKDDEYNPVFELGRTIAVTAFTFFPGHIKTQIINYDRPQFSVVGAFAIGMANNDLSVIRNSVAAYNHFISSSIKEIRSYVLKNFNPSKKKNAPEVEDNTIIYHEHGRCFMNEILQQVYVRCIPGRISALRQYKAFSNNVYGEILPSLLSKMLMECKVKPNDKFLDLGSGVGNCVIQASLEFKCESYGIEIMKGPSDLCVTQYEEFQNRAKYYGLKYGPVNFFLRESFLGNTKLNSLIPEIDIVLVNNYVFDSQLNIEVGLLLNVLKPGAKIIHMKPIGGFGQKDSVSSRLKCYEVPFPNDMVSWTHNSGKFFIGEVQKDYLENAFEIRSQTRSRTKKFGL